MQKDMTYHMLAIFADAFSETEQTYEQARKVTGTYSKKEGIIWHGADL
ncbi:MAG: hypothetical protein KDI34_02360 [Halioglobus sp.]|nr:hypothetical protein [Halioglobus sp.]